MVKASDNEFPSVLFDEQGSDPTTPASGFWRLYFKSTGAFLIDDGGLVVGPLAASAGSTVTMLSDQTVTGSAAANIDFTSISGSYKHLEMYFTLRSNDAAAFVLLNVTFNNDTGSNYDWQRITVTNATQGAGATAGATAARMGLITSSGAAATNNPGGGRLFIPNYTGTVFNKTALSETTEFQTTAASGFLSEQNSMLWRSTAAITRITIAPSAGSFIVGSRATLYGIP